MEALLIVCPFEVGPALRSSEELWKPPACRCSGRAAQDNCQLPDGLLTSPDAIRLFRKGFSDKLLFITLGGTDLSSHIKHGMNLYSSLIKKKKQLRTKKNPSSNNKLKCVCDLPVCV